jgi:hypothetical protein
MLRRSRPGRYYETSGTILEEFGGRPGQNSRADQRPEEDPTGTVAAHSCVFLPVPIRGRPMGVVTKRLSGDGPVRSEARQDTTGHNRARQGTSLHDPACLSETGRSMQRPVSLSVQPADRSVCHSAGLCASGLATRMIDSPDAGSLTRA